MGPSYRHTNQPPTIAAFTVGELVIVIGVTVLLVAVLLPALNQTKCTARRILCVNNVRQLALAAQLYWDENQGRAFRYRGPSINGGDVYWFGWIERGVEGKRLFDPSFGALDPYLDSRRVEICPSLKYSAPNFKYKAADVAFGYGYNLHLSRPMDRAPFSLASLHSSSKTAVFADAAQVNTFQFPASLANPLLEEFYYVSTNELTAHFRHREKATVSFCDGHVSSERPVVNSIDTRMPREFLGRLQPQVLATPD